MDLRARDEARRFYGSRLRANEHGQKALGRAMGVSPQAVSKHQRGEVDSISIPQLRGLAELDLRVALSVINGARVECETAALRGLGVDDLIASLIPAMDREQHPDGTEDCAQQKLATILGTVAFMQDNMALPTRRELTRLLDCWVEHSLAHMDAVADAIARARALRAEIAPVEG